MVYFALTVGAIGAITGLLAVVNAMRRDQRYKAATIERLREL